MDGRRKSEKVRVEFGMMETLRKGQTGTTLTEGGRRTKKGLLSIGLVPVGTPFEWINPEGKRELPYPKMKGTLETVEHVLSHMLPKNNLPSPPLNT